MPKFIGFATPPCSLRNRYDAASRSRWEQTDVRFDDSLATVLAAEASTPAGAASAWRQLVDLMGRGRSPAAGEALDRLVALRELVPETVRAASARALAFARPGAALVQLFCDDTPAVAAPVLRTASLRGDEWAAIVSTLSPVGRAVLRQRRDLPREAEQALASFGSVDFSLSSDPAAAAGPRAPAAAPVATPPPPGTPLGETPFVALGTVARELPLVAEALRRAADVAPAQPVPEPSPHSPPRFEIADLVARIEAFRQAREDQPAAAAAPADRFDFHTDADGAIRWVEGVNRAALVGLSLATGGSGAGEGGAQVDGIATGAFRRRSEFRDARLSIDGLSDAAGSWRISGTPRFDAQSGRFTGYRGWARRPRRDESADPPRPRSVASESLRQLVHELRTPTNAIAGFAELIESQLLGPVAPIYRDRASIIRGQAAGLIRAIDDLDDAARIEGRALELRPGTVPLAALVARIADDLAPLVSLRQAEVVVAPIDPTLGVAGDDRAVERLIGRLMAALVAAGGRGERLSITALRDNGQVSLAIGRPQALASLSADALLSIDAEQEATADDEAAGLGAPLLGTGFALRLARHLAEELGGSLELGADRLTLRLPAASSQPVGQVSIH